MALIKCPECGRQVSEFAESCPDCGYPVAKMASKAKEIQREEELRSQITNVVYCYKKGIQYLYLRCACGGEFRYINTEYKKTVLDNGDYYFQNDLPIRCPKCFAVYDTISFREEVRPKIVEQPKEKIKCPTCGSTNVRRVTSIDKVTNIALFGLFGNKRTKQFHCDDCNYEW